MDPALLQKMGLALGLGLLVGLQRERSSSGIAGFRTFPLVTVLGTLTGILIPAAGWAMPAVGLLAITILCVLGNVLRLKGKPEEPHPGLTTEVALLVMYTVGVYLSQGDAAVAVVIGAAVAFLLYLKPVLHGFAQRLGDRDFRGIMQFVAIALIILPLLPDVPLGPYGAWNPRKIWGLVVLITGISLAGYLLYRYCSAQSSTLLAGVLGGLVSSTATTVSFARRSKGKQGAEKEAALVILLSGSVVFARVLVLIASAAPALLPSAMTPFGLMLGLMLLISGVLWWGQRGEKTALPDQQNPTELRAALIFTLLFALVLVGTSWAKERFGQGGLYAVAVLSGLTDMDAITLSSAGMVHVGGIDPAVAWRVILLAALANMVFKTIMVAILGSRALLWRVGACFGIALAAGAALLALWP